MKKNFIQLIFIMVAVSANLTAQNMDLDWVVPIGGPGGYILTTSMTLDKNNNLFAVGAFTGNIEVSTNSGLVQLTAKGNTTDMFIAKIDPTGKPDWVKHIGGKGQMGYTGKSDLSMNHWFSITSDEVGNLYITGNYRDTVDFDPGTGERLTVTDSYFGGSFPGMPPPLIFRINSFILKLNNDGEFVWVKTIHGMENSASGIAYDANEGTLGITGYFKGKVDFDDKKDIDTLKSLNAQDIFVAKYDTSGNFIWAKQMGGSPKTTYSHDANGIHIDKYGSIYTTGEFGDSADFNPSPTVINRLISTSKAGYNIFVSKLDKDGNYVWAKGMGDVNASTTSGTTSKGFSVTTDNAGNVYTTGYVAGSMVSLDPKNDLMNLVYPSANLTGFISKLDSNGNYVWGKIFEKVTLAGREIGKSIKTDQDGAVYVTGDFMGSVYFDTDFNVNREDFTTISSSNTDPFILKWNTDGVFSWAKQVETDGISRGMALWVASNKDVYAGGMFGGTADFNPSGTAYPLSSVNATQQDGYIMKLICVDTSSVELDVEACGDEYEFLNTVHTASGTYLHVMSNVIGCDSMIYLHLILLEVEQPVINVNDRLLGVTSKYATYQWILDGELIEGATESVHTVLVNGEYQVAVTTEDGCSDTSEVYVVNNALSVNDVQAIVKAIQIYPNPGTDVIHVKSPVNLHLRFTDISGKTVKEQTGNTPVSIVDLIDGLYFIHVSNEKGLLLKVEKLVKNMH